MLYHEALIGVASLKVWTYTNKQILWSRCWCFFLGACTLLLILELRSY